MGVVTKIRSVRREETPEELIARAERCGALFALPFVNAATEGAASYWAPRPRGEYAVDCNIGMAYGRALVRHMREYREVQPLRHVVLDLLKHGDMARDRGLIVGMFGAIGDAIIGGRE